MDSLYFHLPALPHRQPGAKAFAFSSRVQLCIISVCRQLHQLRPRRIPANHNQITMRAPRTQLALVSQAPRPLSCAARDAQVAVVSPAPKATRLLPAFGGNFQIYLLALFQIAAAGVEKLASAAF